MVSPVAGEPFKGNTSVPYSPLGLLDLSPIGFQIQTLWGLIHLVQILRVGVPDVGYEPLASLGEALDL